jgi:hypothetical protein
MDMVVFGSECEKKIEEEKKKSEKIGYMKENYGE